MKNNFVSPVSSEQALESLRHSDFDFYTALFEIIDNSIQAEAQNIWIDFKYQSVSRSRDQLTSVFVLDDGIGMSSSTLYKCMIIGESTRFNDRDGIGRFGVGMTLAAISQCRRITCISRQSSDHDWTGTVLDLDKIASGEYKGIPEPSKELAEKFVKTHAEKFKKIHKDKGTFIVWENLDRVSSSVSRSYDKLVEECDYHLGRVYRKWLMPESVDKSHKRKINLFLNGKKVLFFDPLFSVKSERFPEDPISHPIQKFEPMDWPIPPEVISQDLSMGKSKSKINIIMTLTPEPYRLVGGTGGKGKEFEGKYLDETDNEGVSILRAGREVHFDHLKNYKPQFEERDRWWRCEIQFEPVLDHLFSVKNVKVGVRILKELREAIKVKIEPTRKAFIKEIRAKMG